MCDTRETTVVFTGCKHLQFGNEFSAKKRLIGHPKDEVRVCWDRCDSSGNLQLVQFCKLRGRINYPDQCFSKDGMGCLEYEEQKHCVPLADIET